MKCSLGGNKRIAEPIKSIRNSKDFDFSIIEPYKSLSTHPLTVLFLFYPFTLYLYNYEFAPFFLP